MKKIIKILSICALTCFSFYYTNKMIFISKRKDPIMKRIIKESNNIYISPVNAVITSNYIIPGKNGLKVDIEKSYEKMKPIGKYNENLLVFISDYPTTSIYNNLDKYIIKGNDFKDEISLVFKLDDRKYIKDILDILDKYKVKTTFFIDGKWAEENIDLITNIYKRGYDLGNFGYDSNFNEKDIIKTNMIIKSIGLSDIKYCFADKFNNNIINTCSKNNMYTIKPINIDNIYTYKDVKNNITSGAILSLDTNEFCLKELDIIIQYIFQKGYDLVSLNNLLNEK